MWCKPLLGAQHEVDGGGELRLGALGAQPHGRHARRHAIDGGSQEQNITLGRPGCPSVEVTRPRRPCHTGGMAREAKLVVGVFAGMPGCNTATRAWILRRIAAADQPDAHQQYPDAQAPWFCRTPTIRPQMSRGRH